MPDDQLNKFLTLLVTLVTFATAVVNLNIASMAPRSASSCLSTSATIKSSCDGLTHAGADLLVEGRRSPQRAG